MKSIAQKEIFFFIGIILWVMASLKWGHWKSFKIYQASIFMMMTGDLVYGILTTEQHSYWEYLSPGFGLNHTIIGIAITFVAFPCSILIYLSQYPSGLSWLRQLGYILMWVAIYTILEWATHTLKLMKYDNGWTLYWSIILNCIAFSLLKLNQHKPLVASFLFIGFALFFSIYFEIPIMKLK